MASISLCMIVKDEENSLGECLNSVKGIADEIIVVDTGSTDNTKNIAKKFTDKIFDFKWNNDFSEARNFSINKAAKDWILFLDADEVISKEDAVKIKVLVDDKKSGDIDGFAMLQRNYTDDAKLAGWKPAEQCQESKGYMGYFISPLVRLFRNNKEFYFQYPVHEIIEKSIIEKNGKLSMTQIPIHHYGYAHEGTVFEKLNKYLEIGEEEIKGNPNDPKPYFEVARIHRRLHDLDKALGYFKKAAEINPRYNNPYAFIGEIYTQQNKIKEAVEAYEKAIELHPNDEIAFVNMGVLMIELGRLDDAVFFLNKALKLNSKSVPAYHNLSIALFRKKSYDVVKDVLQKAYENTGLKRFAESINKIKKLKSV